jgi:hypothetical protein
MYYLKIMENDMNSLIYYCRNCGHENDTLTAENVCVSDTQIKRTEDQYVHIVNEYTKFDPTLPRISTVHCPNSQCPSNPAGAGTGTGADADKAGTDKAGTDKAGTDKDTTEPTNREVIYLRYDDANMKYLYVCTVCNTNWKN